VDLREQRNVGARIERLDRRAHPRAASPDDEDVVLRLHYEGSYRNGPSYRAASVAAR
jgi:hypothetical protein